MPTVMNRSSLRECGRAWLVPTRPPALPRRRRSPLRASGGCSSPFARPTHIALDNGMYGCAFRQGLRPRDARVPGSRRSRDPTPETRSGEARLPPSPGTGAPPPGYVLYLVEYLLDCELDYGGDLVGFARRAVGWRRREHERAKAQRRAWGCEAGRGCPVPSRGVNQTKENDLGLIAGPGDASRTTRDSLEPPLAGPHRLEKSTPPASPSRSPPRRSRSNSAALRGQPRPSRHGIQRHPATPV